LHDNFAPGDRLVEIAPFASPSPAQSYIYSLAAIDTHGKRKILLVNKRNHDFALAVDGAAGGQLEAVDVTTGFQPPASTKLASEGFTLHGFSVAVVALP
jgi:hypothetical protein